MKNVFIFLSIMLFSLSVCAQQDAEGCKDPKLFNRMPDCVISQCSENFASLDAVIGPEKTQNIEGTRTHLDYLFNTESGNKKPSWLQVTRNYENAITKLGGSKVYKDAQYATFKLTKEGSETWVMLTMNSGSDLEVDEYLVDVLQKEEMKQDISANDIYAGLNANGSVALYISFETGKADIKPESQGTVDKIAEMLKTNPALKISIEGHTDNVGNASANQTLSENRAKSILAALVAKGIAKNRLSSKGWGQSKPIADNSTDEGKAKNRRVEIVKL